MIPTLTRFPVVDFIFPNGDVHGLETYREVWSSLKVGDEVTITYKGAALKKIVRHSKKKPT